MTFSAQNHSETMGNARAAVSPQTLYCRASIEKDATVPYNKPMTAPWGRKKQTTR
jgi:hypothetical protein